LWVSVGGEKSGTSVGYNDLISGRRQDCNKV
jgi:hypothetical protein